MRSSDMRANMLTTKLPPTVLSICVVLLTLTASIFAALPSPSTTVTTIAFGSCNRHHYVQPLWHSIQQHQPDVFIWLGDIIYGDSHFGGVIRWQQNDVNVLESYYNAQKQQVNYSQFIAQVSVVGIWDDHDYGVNDGDIHYQHKQQSQQKLLDFLDEPADSPRRQQAGAYTQYTIGDEAGKRVQIILLDVRSFQDPAADDGEGDILGHTQWQWLQQTLDSSTADLLLIGSGIQIISTDKRIGEGWKRYKVSRYRLMRMLANQQRPVVLLSGDVHFSEISTTFLCSPPADCSTPAECNNTALTRITPVIDHTSSGLTHAIGVQPPSFVSFSLRQTFYTWLTGRPKDEVYLGLNYGLIEIDWTERIVTLQTRGVNDELHIEQKLSFNALRTHTAQDLISMYGAAGSQFVNDTAGSLWPTDRGQGWSLHRIQHLCIAEDKRLQAKSPVYIGGITAAVSIIIMVVLIGTLFAGAALQGLYKCVGKRRTTKSKRE